jgi:hypothetical protein
MASETSSTAGLEDLSLMRNATIDALKKLRAELTEEQALELVRQGLRHRIGLLDGTNIQAVLDLLW